MSSCLHEKQEPCQGLEQYHTGPHQGTGCKIFGEIFHLPATSDKFPPLHQFCRLSTNIYILLAQVEVAPAKPAKALVFTQPNTTSWNLTEMTSILNTQLKVA